MSKFDKGHMSQIKQRAAKIGSDVERIAQFISAHQEGLKSLILGLPPGHIPVNEAIVASVGRCETGLAQTGPLYLSIVTRSAGLT